LKKSAYLLSIGSILTLTSIFAQAATSDLVYIAVNPCRVVDTLGASAGNIAADASRNFLVSGTSAELAVQGGTTNCPAPRAGSKPLAVSAYIIATPADINSTAGVLTAYPSDQSPPPPGSGSTVNFAAQQTIGNTTTITLCDPKGSCPSDGEFAILSRGTSQRVIVDIQGYYYAKTGSCPDDMVPNGDGCIDKYEASVWTAATGGTQLNLAGATGADDIVCNDDGSDCGANAANPIYARSEAGVLPAGRITWYQAAQACANMGKRLPTTAEWQMAAAGTPPGTGGGCNVAPGGSAANTDANSNCISSVGALNMIGNVWELTSDLVNADNTLVVGSFPDNNTLLDISYGGDFANSNSASSTTSGFAIAPNGINGKVGFRCAR